MLLNNNPRIGPVFNPRPNIVAVLIVVTGVVFGIVRIKQTENPFWLLGPIVVAGVLCLSPKIAFQSRGRPSAAACQKAICSGCFCTSVMW